MAEYIEREALLSELQEEIDFETSMYTDEQNKYFNMGLKCAVRDVKSQPTADVVPRSEVEEHKHNWQKIHDSYTTDCIDHYNKGRTEVAREIFEEIEKVTPKDFTKKSQDFEFGYRLAIQEIIAELKKKYVESEKC